MNYFEENENGLSKREQSIAEKTQVFEILSEAIYLSNCLLYKNYMYQGL